MMKTGASCAVVAAMVFGAALARAEADDPDAPPPVKGGALSSYERQTIRDVLGSLREKYGIDTWDNESPTGELSLWTVRDWNPQGKLIESVDIIPLDVFDRRDLGTYDDEGATLWLLNLLHTRTRPSVVDREVLVTAGQRYEQALVDDTIRNLRAHSQLSLVLIVPLKGSAPDRVRMLVLTKDVWSLRLQWNVGIGTGGLESLVIQPAETNLAGTHQTVGVGYALGPETHTFGANYSVPRLDGRRLVLLANANVIVNRDSGQAEGTTGAVSIARPLFSAKTEWAWGTGVSWSDAILRRNINARLVGFDGSDNRGLTCIPSRPTEFLKAACIPVQYRGIGFTETAGVTRSFGWALKNDFTLGAEMNRRVYHTLDVSAFDPVAVDRFRQYIPLSETRVGPYVQWHGYKTAYTRVLDFETLALQEDFRLGHDLWAKFYPVTTALGSTRSFAGSYLAAQYTIPIGDGLARANIEAVTEFDGDTVTDGSIDGALRFVTPRLGFGRFVVDGGALNRYANHLQRQTYLGGDTRLRGFPSAALAGKDMIVYNVEFRSRSVQILSAQVGAVLFYDAGTAFTPLDANGNLIEHGAPFKGWNHVTLNQSVGGGFRGFFPFFDRVVFRVDFGVPLAKNLQAVEAGTGKYGFFITFGQAFDPPAVGPPSTQGALGQ
jgi:hypothetical protein